MTVRVLLAESDTEDVLFLRDVLEEMESSEFWSGWLHLEIFDAPNWAFSKAILATEMIDVILLDVKLADAEGAQGFRFAQATAPHIPVVLLVEDHDLDLALRLMREGAEDFLVKRHIDCEPLAHAVRNAIERHKLLAAARATAMTDSLTGLLNRAAFQMFADRDRRLAERTGRRMAVMLLEPAEYVHAPSDQHRDLALVEVADHLRGLAGPTDLVARLGDDRFGISLFETDAEPAEKACERYQCNFGARAVRTGAAIFNPYQPSTLDGLLESAEANLRVPAVAAGAS